MIRGYQDPYQHPYGLDLIVKDLVEFSKSKLTRMSHKHSGRPPMHVRREILAQALEMAAQEVRAKGRKPKSREELRKLKQAMASAHPDRGGTSEQFIAARRAYLRAAAQSR
jgi:hypothetical protein